MGETLGVVALTVVVPLVIIFHYVTRWKQMKTLSGEDEQTLERMYRIAERLERRIHSLERILDDENPNWRKSGLED
ncbi:MAG: envelope stress response membrane protein PspB [Sphingomonadales bacterium]|jgi:phage shock protein B